eukprot:g8035.t1
MALKIVWLLVLVVGTRAGWFGPHEFDEGKDKLDLTLRINQKHMAALQRVSGGTGAADTQSIGAQIKAAVASAYYDLAAKLKEQRDKAKATPTGAIDTQSINAQIKAAVARAGYYLAAKHKEQRDKAKATPTGAIDTQSIKAQIKAAVARADSSRPQAARQAIAAQEVGKGYDE